MRQRSVEPKMVERSLGTPDGMSAGPGNGPMGKKALASQEKKIRSVPEDTPPLDGGGCRYAPSASARGPACLWWPEEV